MSFIESLLAGSELQSTALAGAQVAANTPRNLSNDDAKLLNNISFSDYLGSANTALTGEQSAPAQTFGSDFNTTLPATIPQPLRLLLNRIAAAMGGSGLPSLAGSGEILPAGIEAIGQPLLSTEDLSTLLEGLDLSTAALNADALPVDSELAGFSYNLAYFGEVAAATSSPVEEQLALPNIATTALLNQPASDPTASELALPAAISQQLQQQPVLLTVKSPAGQALAAITLPASAAQSLPKLAELSLSPQQLVAQPIPAEALPAAPLVASPSGAQPVVPLLNSGLVQARALSQTGLPTTDEVLGVELPGVKETLKPAEVAGVRDLLGLKPALTAEQPTAPQTPATSVLNPAGNLRPSFAQTLAASKDRLTAAISGSAGLAATSTETSSLTPPQLSVLSSAVNTPTPANPSHQTAIATPVFQTGWGEAVMEKVMWMSSQQINKAEIALDPPELGPLQVRIATQADQTSVVFTSNHAVVRDTLDQGLFRLREMMESQGLNLTDVNVGDQATEQQAEQDQQAQGQYIADSEAESGVEGLEQEAEQAGELTAASARLVDQYI